MWKIKHRIIKLFFSAFQKLSFFEFFSLSLFLFLFFSFVFFFFSFSFFLTFNSQHLLFFLFVVGMSSKQQELNLLIERVRSNDASLGSELEWLGAIGAHCMTLCLTLHHNWSLVGLATRTVTRESFVQFIQALKVNTTLTAAKLIGAASSFHCSVVCYLIFS